MTFFSLCVKHMQPRQCTALATVSSLAFIVTLVLVGSSHRTGSSPSAPPPGPPPPGMPSDLVRCTEGAYIPFVPGGNHSLVEDGCGASPHCTVLDRGICATKMDDDTPITPDNVCEMEAPGMETPQTLDGAPVC